MYKELIGSFDEIRKTLKEKCTCDSVRKIINISNPQSISSISKGSDIICYYDMYNTPSNLIMIVERVPKELLRFKRRSTLRRVQRLLPEGYYASCNKSSDGSYWDYTIISASLKEGLVK